MNLRDVVIQFDVRTEFIIDTTIAIIINGRLKNIIAVKEG